MCLKKNLLRYLDAGFPIIYINAFQEKKIDNIIYEIADRRTICNWDLAQGYSEYSAKDKEYLIPPSKNESTDLVNILSNKLTMNEFGRSIIVIKDAHVILENQEIISLLKEISLQISSGVDCNIILVSSILKITPELEKYITILEDDYQDYNDILNIINQFIEINQLPQLNLNLLEEMATAFKGLSEFEIKNILALSVAEDGELSRKHLKLIFEQKKQMILKSGILEMIPLKQKIEDIGGLENLKEWLERKAKVFKNIKKAQEFGVDMPKGVLIAGIPGCGKSLSAKAAASLFEVPILRLDIGKLMGKYLGESESNLRKAINLVEAISPCVLWIDELEKAFAGIGNNQGHEVTSRLFGTFLTWMQEKTSPSFVVATANDITKLPPELLRKGRFDEIFYVGLPNLTERRKIFEIHIAKRRKHDLANIDLMLLADKTEGYSGADIEGVIREAIENVFSSDREFLTTKDVMNVIKNTNSLSVIMKKSLEKMKKEYEDRKLKNASR